MKPQPEPMAQAASPLVNKLLSDRARLVEALHHVRELAQENAKGQDGYEIIAEWADSLLRELGE